MSQFELSMPIHAAPDLAFQAFCSIEETKHWMPGLVSMEPVNDQPFGEGSKWKETRKMMGSEAMEVVQVKRYAPEKRRVDLYIDGKEGSSGCGEYSFTISIEGDSSPCTYVMSGDMPSQGNVFMRMVGKVMMALFMKPALRKDMEAFKAYVESKAAGSPQH